MTTRAAFQRIGPERARELLAHPKTVVLDSRDPAAFAKSHLDSANRLTGDNIATFISSIPKTAAILIYCYRGKGSLTHAQTFVDFGFEEVYSLDGGYEGWEKDQINAVAQGDPAPLA